MSEYNLSNSYVYLLTTRFRQLTHPLVSPILQGSLCNLPPLYIIAGDGEVLRIQSRPFLERYATRFLVTARPRAHHL